MQKPKEGQMAEHTVVSEILLSLMGEESMLLKLNADETEFVERPGTSLPTIITLELNKLKKLSMSVRMIESWKRNVSGVDSIKRAYVESLSEQYGIFANLVDEIRMGHISRTAVYPISNAMVFLSQWHDRINYLQKLTAVTSNRSGMDLMNIAFNQWCMQCMADWSFKLLENVLHKTSAAFHKIASAWLLDGTVEVKVPDQLIGCDYLVPKILEIGKNIQHLKRFRGQRSYEYKVEQRTSLIEDDTLDKGALWYNIHQRGRLYSIVDQLSTTVSEDVMHELMERQRLLDHMLFVQAHFFMLRGEFTNAIQDAIREASAMDRKRTEFSAIPIPRKQTPSLVAEACLNYALGCTDPIKEFEGLRLCISARIVKAPSLPHHDALSKIVKASNLVDLLQLRYKPPAAISVVLSKQRIEEYGVVFRRVCPVLMLIGDVDEVGLRVAQTSKQSFSEANRVQHKFCRFLSFAVFKIRQFVTHTIRYIFEDVLSVRCSSLLRSMRRDVDVESLIKLHKEFLEHLLMEIEDPMRYLNAIRRTLKVVDHLLASADEKKIPKYAGEICKTLEVLENLLNEAKVEKYQDEDVKAAIKAE